MITYLIDTSAVARILANEKVRQAWRDHLGAGVVAVCDLVELELLFSAGSVADRIDKRRAFEDLFSWAVIPDGVWARAHEVQQMLTEEGKHRGAGVVDLLVAAPAERNGLVLLHYDLDFEAVARAAGQPTAWVTEPGSVD